MVPEWEVYYQSVIARSRSTSIFKANGHRESVQQSDEAVRDCL
jgi:hypothetical protein